MAVNLSVLSSFDASGLNKAQSELDKLQASVSGGMDSLLSSSKLMGGAIIAAAAAAGAALYAMGSQITGAYDNIRVKTGATGEALDAFKGDVRAIVDTIPASFGEAGNAVATFATKLGLSGPQLQDLSKQVIELSRITKTDLGANLDSVAKVMQNFSVGADKQSASLDFLFRASQNSGVGVGQLAASMADTGVQLRAMGFDFNQAASLIATMGKAGIDVSSMMPALNKALASAAKEGKSASEVFSDTFNTIKNAPDSITAAQAALEVFGAKGGVKVAQMIREGKLSYDDMLATITGGTDTIMAAGEDTMHFGEQFTMLKNKAMLALEPIATKLFKAVGDAVAKVIPYVQILTQWLGDHMLVVKAAAVVIGVIAVAALTAYAVAMAAAVAETMLAAAPVIIIAAAIGAMIAATIYLWTHWNQVWNWVKSHPAYAAIILILGQAIIIPILTLVAVGKFLQANWKTIWDAIQTAVQAAWGFIKPIWDAIYGFIVNYLIPYFQFLWTVAQAVFSGISNAISDAWNNVIKPIWDAIYGFIVNYLVPYFQFLWEVVSAVWGAISNAISIAWGTISTVFDWITGGVSSIVGIFSGLGLSIGWALGGIADLIKSPFQSAFNGIVDAWNNTLGGLHFTIPSWVPVFGGDGFTVPKLNHWYHAGGVVDGPLGSNVPAMLQAGEMVLTQRQQASLLNGNAGNTAVYNINVNVSATADKASIGQSIVESIAAYERRSGRGWRAA